MRSTLCEKLLIWIKPSSLERIVEFDYWYDEVHLLQVVDRFDVVVSGTRYIASSDSDCYFVGDLRLSSCLIRVVLANLGNAMKIRLFKHVRRQGRTHRIAAVVALMHC